MRAEVASGESLARLRDQVAAEGGELATALATSFAGVGEAFGPLVAAADRCRSNASEYAFVVESILEGYLVHYWRGRVVEPSNEDLRLLTGDYLYALGLARLAALEDLDAVHELAEVISLCARAHAAGQAGGALPEAIWALGAVGVAGGPWEDGKRVRQAIRAEEPSGAVRGTEAALERAAELGMGPEAQRALIAFREVTSGDPAST
jgi:hypothetical protein